LEEMYEEFLLRVGGAVHSSMIIATAAFFGQPRPFVSAFIRFPAISALDAPSP
jgi:hypothetical protein